MSEEMNALQLENKNLQDQLANNSKGVENLLAQFEAHKQMLNEQLQANIALRTNSVLLQKELQQFKGQVEVLNNKLVAASDKVLSLEAAAQAALLPAE